MILLCSLWAPCLKIYMNEDNLVYDYVRLALGLTFFLGRVTQDVDTLDRFTSSGMESSQTLVQAV